MLFIATFHGVLTSSHHFAIIRIGFELKSVGVVMIKASLKTVCGYSGAGIALFDAWSESGAGWSAPSANAVGLAWSATLSGSWPRRWGLAAILPSSISAIAASSLSGTAR
jgi:hypothetical protein